MGKKQWVITGCVVGGLVLLYTAGGFWGVPAGINWALTKYADPFLDRKVTTEKIEFNPYTLHLQVQGFNVQKEGEEHPLLHLNGLDTKVDWTSVIRLSPMVEFLSLDGLQAYIIRTGLSEFNFSDIIKKIQEMPAEEKEKKSEEAQKFSVKEIRLTNSEITLDDKFRGKLDKVTDLNFDLPLISNFKDEIEHPITPKLSFNFDGKPFDIDAKSVPFTVAQKTGVDFVIKDLDLKNAATFNPIKLNASVEDGSLNAKLNLSYASEDKDQPKYLRLKGNINISNLVIDDTMNSPYRILGVKEIDININEFAYFRQIVNIGEIKITGPQIAVTRSADSINLTDLANHLVKTDKQDSGAASAEVQKTDTEKTEDSAPWLWSVEKVTVADGNVDFKDNTNGFHSQISSIESSVGPLSAKKGTDTQVSLNLNVIGGSLSTSGTLTIDPLNVNLNAKTQGLSIPDLGPYLDPFVNIKVNSGTFGNEGTISLALESGEPSFAYNGSADIKDISISDPAGPVASFADLLVQGIDVKNKPGLSVDVASVNLASPAVNVVRLKNGAINLTTLAKSSGASKEAEKPAEAAKTEDSVPLQWNVQKITVADGNVDFKDNTNGFHSQISLIQSSVGPISAKKGTNTQVSLNLNVIGGSLSTNGSLTIDPLSVNLNANTQGLSIPAIGPYIAPFVNAKVNSGTFSNEGTISLALGSGEPSFAYKGSADLKGISISGPMGPVASFADLSVQGVDVKNTPNLSIDVVSADLVNPVVNIVKSKDGVINLTTLAKSSGSTSETEKAAETPKTENSGKNGLPAINLGKVGIQQGSVRYKDDQTTPVFHADLSKLVATLSGFTTTRDAPAQIKLNGLLNGTPIAADGSINPFASSLTLKMNGSVQALSLPAFSPFSVEFTGYPIKQGQLNFEGSYDIAQDQLKSDNAFVINKLEFGPESPNAKETLPVGLAVSLLADRSGKIDLNIPVEGSLNDPEFSVGGIIVQVIANLVTKAITAPFALIGSMFGGEGLDLSHLQFQAGSAKIEQKTLDALEVLTKAMNERPGFKIQILGVANDKFDEKGLKEELLERKMRQILFKADAAKNRNKKLTAAQITQAINTLYAEADVKNKPKLDTEKAKKEFLLKMQKVTSKELLELADRRALAVRDYLVQKGKIAADRLFLVNPETGTNTDLEAGVKLDLQS